MFLPLFIGAFAGGPLIARELETGTYRFAWAQSVGRTRWVIAKLVVLGLTLTLMALAFSALFGSYRGPLNGAGQRGRQVLPMVRLPRIGAEVALVFRVPSAIG